MAVRHRSSAAVVEFQHDEGRGGIGREIQSTRQRWIGSGRAQGEPV